MPPLAGPRRAAPGARPTRAAETSRAVLDAAARLFRERGYAAPSLRDIAAAAGIQAGSLYYHFDSKEAIVSEVLRAGVEAVSDGVRTATDDARARGLRGIPLLEAAIRAHLESLLRVGDYTSANIRILGHVPPAVRRGHVRVRDGYEALWRDLLVEARDGGALSEDVDLETLRLFVFGAMNGALEWYRPGKKSIDRLARDLCRCVFYGVAGAAARRNR